MSVDTDRDRGRWEEEWYYEVKTNHPLHRWILQVKGFEGTSMFAVHSVKTGNSTCVYG